MSVRTRHRIEFGFSGLVLTLSLLIWRGIRAGGTPEEIPIYCYGGNLSSGTRSALQSMNRDLHDARGVLAIGSRGVLIEDRSGRMKEYRCSGSMLFADGVPLVSGVNALHFEYRDEWGNLLTHRSGNCGVVRIIAYTVRLEDRSSEMFINSKTTVPYNQGRSTGPDPSRVAFVQSP
jgi:hypothetical protein